MILGTAIRAARLSLKVSQSDLAEQIGVSRRALAALERDTGRVATLLALASVIPIQITGLDYPPTLPKALARTRQRQGVSLRELGRRANISVNTLRSIEAGGGSIPALIRIIAALSPRAKVRVFPTRTQVTGFTTVGRRTNRDGRDHYATPAPVIRLLLDHEEFDPAQPILEPAAGEQRVIERVLLSRDFDVVAYDLNFGPVRGDFLKSTKLYHTVITNPPFHLHRQFAAHAKRIATHKIALLLPLNNLTGAARYAELWQDRDFPLARVHVLTRGVNFLTPDPHAERYVPSQMYCAWFVFDRHHEGPTELRWIDANSVIERRSPTAVLSRPDDILRADVR